MYIYIYICRIVRYHIVEDRCAASGHTYKKKKIPHSLPSTPPKSDGPDHTDLFCWNRYHEDLILLLKSERREYVRQVWRCCPTRCRARIIAAKQNVTITQLCEIRGFLRKSSITTCVCGWYGWYFPTSGRSHQQSRSSTLDPAYPAMRCWAISVPGKSRATMGVYRFLATGLP